ncbi:MAG: site-specific integrase [Planctomycetota bacterium]|nr:site-specific integrase [Planctomycetota bacterium]
MRVPKYRKMYNRDLGCGTFKRHVTCFPGPYNSPESREAYRLWLRDTVMVDAPAVFEDEKGPVSLPRLVHKFLDFAEGYYDKGEYDNLRYALIPLAEYYKNSMAVDFSPKRFKDYLGTLAKKKQARGYVNNQRRKIIRMYLWAGEEEIVPGEIGQRLLCVKGLREGRTEAREPEKLPPIQWEWIEAALGKLSDHLHDMLLIQWYTLVRSDSLVNAKGEQFADSGGSLFWRPKHKTQKQGKELIVPIGPQCKAVLQPYLDKAEDPTAPLWSPRAVSGNRRYRPAYSTYSYRQAIARAAERVNTARVEANLEPFPHWTPHHIRHSRGQMIRERFGAEAAQSMLGHASLTATQIYTSKRLALAQQIANELG